MFEKFNMSFYMCYVMLSIQIKIEKIYFLAAQEQTFANIHSIVCSSLLRLWRKRQCYMNQYADYSIITQI